MHTRENKQERVVCMNTWYGGGPNRNLDELLLKEGFGPWVQEHVMRKHLPWGLRRFVNHNLHGWDHGEHMEIDEAVEASNKEAFARITNRSAFIKAWKPVSDLVLHNYAYVGLADGDPEIEAFKKPDKFDNQLEYLSRCFRLYMDAGMGIVFDAAVSQKYVSVNHACYLMAKACGVECAVEANPAKHSPWWAYELASDQDRTPLVGYQAKVIPSYTTVFCDAEWWYSHGTQDGWNVKPDDLGEIILFLNVPWDGSGDWDGANNWAFNYAKRILADGFTVAIMHWRLEQMMAKGIRLADLLE